MVKKAQKRLVNHKLYCGKYYARIGGQFKELDISSRHIAMIDNHSPIENTLDFEKPFTFRGVNWHAIEVKVSHGNAYNFAKLEVEAVHTEGQI